MASLPNFTSIQQVRTYLDDHRDILSMVDITNACDLALDPGFIRRDAIARFVHSLPRAQQQQFINDMQQLSEDECLLCCKPYDADSGAHFPVALPCGHVIGSSCLKKSLKDTDICFECGATVFTAPAAATTLTDPEHEGILRGLVQSGGVFLEERSWVLGSDKSYAAFFSWAHGHGTDHDSIIARLHAKETIRKLDTSR